MSPNAHNRRWRVAGFLVACAVGLCGCPQHPKEPGDQARQEQPSFPAKPKVSPPWHAQPKLEEGQVYAMRDGVGKVATLETAQAEGLTVVDLSDVWAPHIFSEQEPGQQAKPQPYRQIFVQLANDEVDPDVLYLRGDGPTKVIPSVPVGLSGKARDAYEEARDKQRQKDLARLMAAPVSNFLEPFGIPPTLKVLRKRIEQDEQRKDCFAQLDRTALQQLPGELAYQDMSSSRRDYQQAMDDEAWLRKEEEALAQSATAGTTTLADAGSVSDALAADPTKAARVARAAAGHARVGAVKAAQTRLVCEGLIGPGNKFSEGMFDLVTHEALAAFERKNDIFSWGILGGETAEALARPPLELHWQTFRRIVTERMVDAAGIIEDETVANLGKLARYKDESGQERLVSNLVGAHVDALMAAMGVTAPEALFELLRTVDTTTFKVAFAAPQKPPYYAQNMNLEVEIDRGDIWYDFPYDEAGKPLPQPRQQYPHLTLFVRWANQRIPLARWRTTIGSWRSERHPDGNVYFKYKNSDVGPRIWKHIVVSPVWVPPDGTPPKDMLTRKKWNPYGKPETVVNTDVVGPGFQSAYGLVMAIHHQVTPGGGLFDNQIRTHGSVDYTSIARRYSHGCHRLVNIRAVRLFGFVLRHSPFERIGDQKLGIRKRFAHEGQTYEYQLGSRGYYYRLERPIKVEVLEGRIAGNLDKPITAFVRKPGTVVAEPAPSDTAEVDPAAGAGEDTVADVDTAALEDEGATPAAVLPAVISPSQARSMRGSAKFKGRR